MKVNPKYKLHQIVSKDELRQAILNINLRSTPEGAVLEATDGYVLAIVPAEVTEQDSAGLITPEAYAGAISSKSKELEVLELGLEWDGSKGIRCVQIRPTEHKFPEDTERFFGEPRVFKASFNPTLLVKLAQALGSPDDITLEFPENKKRNILVTTHKDDQVRGLLMPIRE